MTRFILLLFIFSNLCFAEDTCKSLGSEIEHINESQNKILNKDNLYEDRFNINKAIGFLKLMNTKNTKINISEELESFSLADIKIFKALDEDCASKTEADQAQSPLSDFESCKAKVAVLLNDPEELKRIKGSLQTKISVFNTKYDRLSTSEEIISFGVVKKFLAQKFITMKCTKELSGNELSESAAYNYACRDQVHRPHTEGIKVFAEDNLDILLKLQLENNNVTDLDFKKSCATLMTDPKFKKVLPSCPVGKIGGAVVSKVTKKVTKKDDKDPVVTTPKDKTKDEFKNKDDRKPAAKNKVVKDKLDPNSYKAKRARKRKKTWKTIGIVAAAAGATGLAVWGLTELFKPTPSTLEFNAHPDAGTQRYTQSYDMNAYQQYMMYQNNQSNQNMMYQANLYQGSTYGYGNNWIGAQDSSASSPYTFEYGF